MADSTFGQSLGMIVMSAVMFIMARTQKNPTARRIALVLGYACLAWLIFLFIAGAIVPRIT